MTNKSLTEYTEMAIWAADHGEALPALVHLPPALRGKKPRVVHLTHQLPDVRDSIIRIQSEVDPIGLLIAIANGQPIAEIRVDQDGKTYLKAVNAGMKERMQAIKALADRVHPRMSVNKQISSAEDKPRTQSLIENAERDAG
jgi:hypothetical protein